MDSATVGVDSSPTALLATSLGGKRIKVSLSVLAPSVWKAIVDKNQILCMYIQNNFLFLCRALSFALHLLQLLVQF